MVATAAMVAVMDTGPTPILAATLMTQAGDIAIIRPAITAMVITLLHLVTLTVTSEAMLLTTRTADTATLR